MMLCRAITEADIDAFRSLRLRGLKDHPADFAADYDEEAAWPLPRWIDRLPAARTYVVDEDGALIACASLRVPEGKKIRHNGWINAMYVVPEMRGRSVGDLLMGHIEHEARRLGVTMLKLSLRDGNDKAERFYMRLGFTKFGREPASHIVDGVAYDSLEMWRPLA